MKRYSRREILRAIALGGGLVAGKLWIPGEKVISIPKLEKPGTLRLYAGDRLLLDWDDYLEPDFGEIGLIGEDIAMSEVKIVSGGTVVVKSLTYSYAEDFI